MKQNEQIKPYLSIVRAHGSTASVRVGELVPLIIPGPDQVSDGLVPATVDHESILTTRRLTVHHLTQCVLCDDLSAQTKICGPYRAEVIARFWPMYFMACVGP